LLDEPTSSLDPISTAKIEELIQELEQQYSIIMVTHNLKQAKRLGKQTVFMADGKIIEKRPTEELFANPNDERTKRYIEKH
jgi:phosphate transport system ATP-binding protein